MICPKCNNNNPDGMKFCSYCGSPLTGKTPTARKNPNGLILARNIFDFLCIAFVVMALFFVYSRTNYTETGPVDEWETCDGHCVEMTYGVMSPFGIVCSYEIEAFNVIPPCNYSERNSLMENHKPLTNENLNDFTALVLKNYQDRTIAWTLLMGAIALVLYMIRRYIDKRIQSVVSRKDTSVVIE